MPCSGLNELIKFPKAIFRTLFVIINNLYCVPTYLLWMLLLLPLKKVHEKYYHKIEGVLFHWLLANVTMWTSMAGYDLVEMGDDITPCLNSRTLVLANHQSTSDVPMLMSAFNPKKGVVPNIMWIMDRVFRYTNFGVVSLLHRDFFIASGKAHREQSLNDLRDHIRNVFIPWNRKWLILFPEGGFLRKRKAVSQRFAEKNNLPVLHNVTVPRVGAMKVIIEVMCPQTSNGSNSNSKAPSINNLVEITSGIANHKTKKLNLFVDKNRNDDCDNFNDAKYNHLNAESKDCIEYVLDITIAYPNGVPLDLPNIVHGYRDPCQTYLYYRLYRSSEVPQDSEALTNWLYERFFEKEKLLEEFYRTGTFSSSAHPPSIIQQDLLRFLLIHLFFITSTYVHLQLMFMLYAYYSAAYVYFLS